MPATPAWPPASTPRLFTDTPLAAGAMVALDGPAAHYLLNVMRAKPGDPLLLFDNRSGEWLGAVAEASKRALSIRIEHQMRPIERVPDLWLCFAPVKKARLDWIIEKATELGVARLKLPQLLKDWPVGRALLFADEAGGAPLAAVAAPAPAAILTGPEGGFTDRERAMLIDHDSVKRIALGPRILRAETAAIAATALWMAQHGDWRGG